MKDYLHAALIVILSLLLYGCGTTVVTKVEYRVTAVPKTMTLPCVDVPPPDYYTFMTLPIDKRIDLLGDRSFKQSLVLVTCNNKLKAIDAWVDKEVAIYKSNPGEKK